jgi:hypothetical protein
MRRASMPGTIISRSVRKTTAANPHCAADCSSARTAARLRGIDATKRNIVQHRLTGNGETTHLVARFCAPVSSLRGNGMMRLAQIRVSLN